MSTIPASELVNVVPSVLGAGGSALDIIGLILTNSTRIPIGAVQSFPDAASVADFFGGSSQEADLGLKYFAGFDGATKLPAQLLMAQYNTAGVSAYVRGGDVSAMTLAALQALTGTMIVVVDGATHAGAINLAGATSFSNAATIIQTALNTATQVTGHIDPNSFTGHIDPNAFTGSIAGTTLTVSAIATGVLAQGQTISGANVVGGTTIVQQLTGTAGSTGTYQVSISQTVASQAMTASGGGLTITAVGTGLLAVGQTVSGAGVTAGTVITKAGTGTGGTGTYAVNNSQTVGSETLTTNGGTLTVTAVIAGVLAVGDVLTGAGITAGNTITAQGTGTGGTGTYLVSVGDTVGSETITVAGAGAVVTYDSTSGGFQINSGITGPSSTMTFPTGAIATSLKLTSATGAALSQGAAAASPAAFMTALTNVTTNWVTFMTAFDPDTAGGNAQKQAFSTWKDTQNDRYAYICWDTDITPTTTLPATGSLGYLLGQAGDSGTALIWAPDATTGAQQAAFVCGAAASINFAEVNGRITFAYRAQAGLPATVTTAVAANNLGGSPQSAQRGNGYDFYGVYANASPSFVWLQRGFVTGDFQWLDSYINQVWINNSLQTTLLNLLKNAKSIPYGTVGASTVETALADPIEAGLDFGAFGPGELSGTQIAEVNADAGLAIANTIQTQGWYLQVLPGTPTQRAARTSPPCKFWYLDRGSIQAINLASVAVQ